MCGVLMLRRVYDADLASSDVTKGSRRAITVNSLALSVSAKELVVYLSHEGE